MTVTWLFAFQTSTFFIYINEFNIIKILYYILYYIFRLKFQFLFHLNEIIGGSLALIHYVYLKCRDHFTSVGPEKVLSSL